MTFENLGLSPALLRTLVEAGYTTPTEIQDHANPLVLDVVVDRLCQDPDDWQAFSWRSALSRKWSPTNGPGHE